MHRSGRGFLLIAPLLWTAAISAQNDASVSGIIQVPSGEPIPGGSVSIEAMPGQVLQSTRTDKNGAFRFSGLAAGAYTLHFRALGFFSVSVKQVLLAGEHRSIPAIRLPVGASGDCSHPREDPSATQFLATGPALGGLAGTVTAGQKPLAGVPVILRCFIGLGCGEPRNTATDSQGHFEFGALPPGRYFVSIESSSYSGVGFTVAGGIESTYSFPLNACPDGDCTVQPQRAVKTFVCE